MRVVTGRGCHWCGAPLTPEAPPWRAWCGDACKQRAYRARRQALKDALRLRMQRLLEAGHQAEAVREQVVEGCPLPSLRPLLGRELERLLRRREELRRVPSLQEIARMLADPERLLLQRYRRLLRTGRRRPDPYDLPPEEPRRGERRAPFPCERCGQPLAFEIAPGLAHCARCGARFPVA